MNISVTKRDIFDHNQYGLYVNVAVYTIAVRQPCFNCSNRWFSCFWGLTVHEHATDAGRTVLTRARGKNKNNSFSTLTNFI